MERNYCSVHHLYYQSSQCPCCLKDHSEALGKRFYAEPVKLSTEVKKEPSEADLEALVAKFKTR